MNDAYAVVESASLTMHDAAGLLAEYESSPNRRKHSCSRCGAQLVIRRIDRQDITVVTMGTLEDDPAGRPSRHAFTASKAPWYDLDDALPGFEVYPGFETSED